MGEAAAALLQVVAAWWPELGGAGLLVALIVFTSHPAAGRMHERRRRG